VNQRRDNLGVEIHGFANASIRAYATVVYIRILTTMTEVHTHLLVAKTKVAPIKTVSIPRLELNALVLLSRLIHWTVNSLHSASIPCYEWTDSSVALAWLSQHPSKWKTYVANRVSEIQETIPTIKWGHVPSAQNPADVASRGISADDLKDHPLWWHGPQWLQHHYVARP